MPVDFRIQTIIDKTGNKPVIRFKDLTDYGVIALNTVELFFQVMGPLGDIHVPDYPNTPDIDRGVTDTSDNYILPLTSIGEIPEGLYLVLWTALIDGNEYIGEFDFEYSFSEPKPKLKVTYSCLKSELISLDDTNYQVDGQDYLSTTLSHKIKWPLSSENPDVSSTAAEVKLGPNIWTGNYHVELVSKPIYSIAQDVIVIGLVSTSMSSNVVCDIDYCKLSIAVQSLREQRDCMNNKSSGEYSRLDYVVGRATELLALATSSLTCDEKRVEDIYRDLYILLNGYDCGCEIKAQVEDREVEPILSNDCCPNLYIEW